MLSVEMMKNNLYAIITSPRMQPLELYYASNLKVKNLN